MIDCDCIGRSVSFLVCRKHWRYVQLVQALSREGDANIPTDPEIKQTSLKIPDICTYLVCLIIQAIFSVVQKLAAIIRSPSFSLFSSSITTRNSPRVNAANASSIESNANDGRTWGFCTCFGGAELAIAGIVGFDFPFAFTAAGNGAGCADGDTTGAINIQREGPFKLQGEDIGCDEEWLQIHLSHTYIRDRT